MKSGMNLGYKRASLLDLMFLIVVIFALALSSIIAIKIYDAFHENTQDKLGSEANQLYENQNSIMKTGLDNIIIFALVGFAVATMIMAFQINTHPAFFFISLFILVIILVIAANISNSYNTISGEQLLQESAQYLPKTAYVMNHLPIFILGFAIILMIVMFGVRAG